MGYMVRIYLSKVRLGLTQDEVDNIVCVSRERNAACRVSGMLLSGNGMFLQLLEGPGPAVERTYRRVLSDSRHRDVVLVYDGIGEPLRFTDWPMGYARADQYAHLAAISPLIDGATGHGWPAIGSDVALKLLLDIRRDAACVRSSVGAA
jgi:hypothetical protein